MRPVIGREFGLAREAGEAIEDGEPGGLGCSSAPTPCCNMFTWPTPSKKLAVCLTTRVKGGKRTKTTKDLLLVSLRLVVLPTFPPTRLSRGGSGGDACRPLPPIGKHPAGRGRHRHLRQKLRHAQRVRADVAQMAQAVARPQVHHHGLSSELGDLDPAGVCFGLTNGP